ncbi:MAG: membrane protein insertase YidC [Proteobacteria bacterium]|nr:membrane protein insertase YidC [Pseudomonadota bacterium]MBI3499682.1 membrane protein insertase YidC [Pseudomonadota bacterium]
MSDQKNLLIAIVLSLAILLGFQFLYEMPRTRQQQALQQQTEATQPGAPPGTGTTAPPAAQTPGAQTNAPTSAAPAAAGPVDRASVLAQSPRIKIDTPRLMGSIALTGGRVDDVVLKDYREAAEPDSPNIVVLSPIGTHDPYYGEFGWVAEQAGVKLPDADTAWTADRTVLTPAQPVTLRWDNGDGLRFERVYSVDDNFMIMVTQRVANNSGKALTLYPFALVLRTNTPTVLGYYILHEGMLGVLDGTLTEIAYSKLAEQGKVEKASTGGWLGITDKYWLAAVIPDQQEAVKARFTHTLRDRVDRYQADYLGAGRTVEAGAAAEASARLFAGAKEVRLLDHYKDSLGIARFDLGVDFGWFYFLTKPIFYVLDFLYRQIGNFGLAILVLTVAVKGLFFPLANKSYKAMSKMKALQPEMTKLRERFGDDRAKINQEMMALYKREKVNPAAGCLPVVVQIPVFFSLYKVLFITIEMRHAPFYGWIRDLSSPDPTTIFNLFGFIPWSPPSMLMIGAWPLLMGVTMLLQQRLNPQPADPIQAKMFMALPIVFTVMLANFPSGLVIYWAWNNLLSIAQQWTIMRRAGVKA